MHSEPACQVWMLHVVTALHTNPLSLRSYVPQGRDSCLAEAYRTCIYLAVFINSLILSWRVCWLAG